MIEVKKNDRVEIHKAARAHQVAGIKSATNDLPAEIATATVRKVTKTKNGRKMHVQDDCGYGYAVMIDNLPEFMTVHVV